MSTFTRFTPYNTSSIRRSSHKISKAEQEEHIYDEPDDTTLPKANNTFASIKKSFSPRMGHLKIPPTPPKVPPPPPLRRNNAEELLVKHSQERVKIVDHPQPKEASNLNEKVLKKISNMLNMNENENYVVIIDNLETERSHYSKQLYERLKKKNEDVVLLSLNQILPSGATFSDGALGKPSTSCRFNILIILLSHAHTNTQMLIHSDMSNRTLTPTFLVNKVLDKMKNYKYEYVNCIKILYKSDSPQFKFKDNNEHGNVFGYEISIANDKYSEIDEMIQGLIESN